MINIFSVVNLSEESPQKDSLAKTPQEAIQKIKSMSDFECDSVVYDNELILETCEDMNYDENSNQPTREIFYNGRMIADNTPIEVKRDKIIDSLIR